VHIRDEALPISCRDDEARVTWCALCLVLDSTNDTAPGVRVLVATWSTEFSHLKQTCRTSLSADTNELDALSRYTVLGTYVHLLYSSPSR
jgi:hypothetical protein